MTVEAQLADLEAKWEAGTLTPAEHDRLVAWSAAIR